MQKKWKQKKEVETEKDVKDGEADVEAEESEQWAVKTRSGVEGKKEVMKRKKERKKEK